MSAGMKLALAQIDPTVGDFSGNRDLILARYREAARRGADLVLFPELAVAGYPPRDLLERPAFLREAAAVLAELAAASGETALVVGFPEANPGAAGRPCFNAAAFLARGKVVATYRKRLLPLYDVFDEERHFEPGTSAIPPVPWRGLRVGITICEDIWAHESVFGRRIYQEDPLSEAAKGADLVLNLSASPFELGKTRARLDLVRAQARRVGVPIAIANQVGGNDELVFDGTSALISGEGEIRALAASFTEDLVVCDTGAPPIASPPPRPDVEDLHDALVLGLADYVRKSGFRTACLGLSGGIDSAVTAAIAARALGPENVLGVLMPSRFTSRRSLDDAMALAANLRIRTETVPIEPVFRSFLETLAPVFRGAAQDVTEENLQARIRGTILMALSNKFGHMVLSTGNKSELSMGYCTLYGDLCGGLAVISDVPKTLVYALAAHLNEGSPAIPASTLSREPTAELRFDQKDADSLPPYEVLDPILKGYVEGKTEGTLGAGREVAAEVVRRVQAAEYKRRQAPPGLRVTSKAFGMGRRMPIAQKWKEP